MKADEGSVGYSTSSERQHVQIGLQPLGRRLRSSATSIPTLFCTHFSSSTSEHLAEERVWLSVEA